MNRRQHLAVAARISATRTRAEARDVIAGIGRADLILIVCELGYGDRLGSRPSRAFLRGLIIDGIAGARADADAIRGRIWR